MPEWRAELLARLARLHLQPAREHDIVEELSQHLDDRWRELVDAGETPDAATRLALEELDGTDLLARRMASLRQAHAPLLVTPGQPGRRLLGDLWQDVRYAARLLVRQKGFAAAAILTLALGIGVNTAIFSLVDATLLQRLPVRDADRLVFVHNNQVRGVFPFPAYADLRDRNDVLDGLAGWGGVTVSLGIDDATDLVGGAIVTGNYFELLGVGAERGRVLSPADDVTPMGHPVAVISHGLWQRRFGGAADIVGRHIRLNGQPFTVVGVVGPDFPGAEVGVVRDLYVPMMMQPLIRPPRAGYSGDMNPDLLHNRNNGWVFAAGRLKPGVTTARAETSLSALQNELLKSLQALPAHAPPRRVPVTPFLQGDPRQRAQMVSVARLLFAIVGAVLLIACANVANLLLSRAAARRREIALRLAIGASRGRLMRQLLTESVLLGLAGGIAGAGLAWAIISGFRAAAPPPGALPLAIDFSMNARVLVFALVLSAATGLIFGFIPAWRAARPGLLPGLKAEPEAGLSRSRWRRLGWKRGLVVAEVAMSLALVLAAGLFVRSLRAAQAVDPGLDAERLISTPININLLRYTRDQGRLFYQRLIDELRAQPGVEDAALARVAVVAGGGRILTVQAEGQTGSGNRMMSEGGGMTASAASGTTAANVVTPGFFRTLGIPFVRGRNFDDTDAADAPRVAIASETFASAVFPNVDPIGRRVDFSGGQGPWVTIVAIVRDSTYAAIGETPTPVVYLPLSQNHETGMTCYVRTAGPPAAMAAQIRQTVRSLEPNLPVTDSRPVTETIGASLYVPRMGATLLGAFGALALVLAGIGIYGVLAFSIAQRTRELGIRAALGATTSGLFGLVLREGMGLVALGALLGLTIAAFGARALAGFLYGIEPFDTRTFILGPIVLLVVAFAACLIPARRATKVDPIEALKS